jgi:transcriptional regulator with XRE-family HTH domain
MENPDFDTLGGRISRARDGLNLSTAQLARRLGVKSNTVSDWETDRSEPRANRITMLAGVLGVSPTWLLTGIGESPSAPEVNSELRVLLAQLSRLRASHASMGRTIETLELEAERISAVLAQ